MELSIIFIIIILIFFSPLILGLIFMGAQKKINLRHTNSSLNKPGFVDDCVIDISGAHQEDISGNDISNNVIIDTSGNNSLV